MIEDDKQRYVSRDEEIEDMIQIIKNINNRTRRTIDKLNESVVRYIRVIDRLKRLQIELRKEE